MEPQATPFFMVSQPEEVLTGLTASFLFKLSVYILPATIMNYLLKTSAVSLGYLPVYLVFSFVKYYTSSALQMFVFDYHSHCLYFILCLVYQFIII